MTATMAGFMGATDAAYQQMTLAYIDPIIYGTIFFITVQMLTAILNTQGNTGPGRNFLIGGFFLNLLLDPWFIFGGFGLPAMDITGIAVATVLVQLLGCLYMTYEVSKSDLITRESIRRFSLPSWRITRQIVKQGFPNMLDMMGVSFGFFVLNYYVSWFGQDAVATLGAASRIEQVALLPLLGLNVAVLALVAQNNGAGLSERVQAVYRKSLIYGSIIMLITMILVIVFARPLMAMFSSDIGIVEEGVEYIQIRSLGLIPNAFFFMSSSALRGIERPVGPLVLNMIRFVGLPWLLIVIFVQWLGFGLTAIWVTSTVAFFGTAIAAVIMAKQELPKMEEVI